MNRGEIRTRIKNRLNEDAVFRTNAQIDQGIDEAGKLIALLALPFRKNGSVVLDAGVAVGHFPTDFIAPLRLSVSGRRLFPVTPRQLSLKSASWMTDAGVPTHYFQMSFLDNPAIGLYCKFWVYPRPTVLTTVAVDYAYLPATLADGDAPTVPQAFHGLWEEYGAYRGYAFEAGTAPWARGEACFKVFLEGIKDLQDRMMAQYQGMDSIPIPFDAQEEKRVALARQ